MISVEFYDIVSFKNLQSVWENLQTGADMTAFQSFDWYKIINEQYKNKANFIPGKAVYAVAYEDNIAKMIAPVHILKVPQVLSRFHLDSGAYVLGKWGYTDYLNFIYCDFSPQCFEKIITAIKEKFKISNFFMHQICRDTVMSDYLKTKFPESIIFDGECARIVAKNSFEDYYFSLSKSVRQNLRTAQNRAQKDNFKITYEIKKEMSNEDAMEFFEIYLERQKIKNSSSSFVNNLMYDLQSFYKRIKIQKYNFLVECLKGNASVFTIGFYAGEEKIGFCLVADDSVAFRVPVVCFKQNFARYSPGMVCIFNFIKDSYVNGSIKDFDLLKGTEKYKFDLGAEVFTIGYHKI